LATTPTINAQTSSVRGSIGPPPLEDDEPLLVPLAEELPEADPELAEAAVTVVVADADLVESAVEAAVMVTAEGLGIAAGAVYTPADEIVPMDVFPPAIPFTLQVTAVLGAFATVAVNACVAPAATLASTGLMNIETDALMVTCTVAYLVESDVQRAFTVTIFGDGTEAGGV
jgi:hypothetical protein